MFKFVLLMRSVTVDFRERASLSPEPRPPSSHSWGFNLPWINLVSVRAGESISELIRSPLDNQSVAVWTTDLFMESCVQWRMSWLISCFSYRPSGGKNMFAAYYKKKSLNARVHLKLKRCRCYRLARSVSRLSDSRPSEQQLTRVVIKYSG